MKVELTPAEIEHLIANLKRQRFSVEDMEKIELVRLLLAKLEVAVQVPLFPQEEED